jgi:prepilin-type N-terminal cleavage/methylation domain-containing protein
MKKKGFTLVELLAVIAILAILVIVAMPNVLGMFNQAKYNTFVTEVQSYMDAAKTGFVSAALTKPAQSITFSSIDADTTNDLSMSGNKNYYVVMDRFGKYERVVIWDTNYCYDSKTAASQTQTDIKKEKVVAGDVTVQSVYVAGTANTYPNVKDGTTGKEFCKGNKANAN